MGPKSGENNKTQQRPELKEWPPGVWAIVLIIGVIITVSVWSWGQDVAQRHANINGPSGYNQQEVN